MSFRLKFLLVLDAGLVHRFVDIGDIYLACCDVSRLMLYCYQISNCYQILLDSLTSIIPCMPIELTSMNIWQLSFSFSFSDELKCGSCLVLEL